MAATGHLANWGSPSWCLEAEFQDGILLYAASVSCPLRTDGTLPLLVPGFFIYQIGSGKSMGLEGVLGVKMLWNSQL